MCLANVFSHSKYSIFDQTTVRVLIAIRPRKLLHHKHMVLTARGVIEANLAQLFPFQIFEFFHLLVEFTKPKTNGDAHVFLYPVEIQSPNNKLSKSFTKWNSPIDVLKQTRWSEMGCSLQMRWKIRVTYGTTLTNPHSLKNKFSQLGRPLSCTWKFHSITKIFFCHTAWIQDHRIQLFSCIEVVKRWNKLKLHNSKLIYSSQYSDELKKSLFEK